MNRLYGLTLTALATAALIYAIFEWHFKDGQEQNQTIIEESPDFIAKNLQTDVYDESGELTYTVHADRMEHFSTSDVTNFEQPNYTLFSANAGLPWKMSAAAGQLEENTRVILNNNVRLSTEDKSSMLQAITGEYIELDLTTSIATSDKAIVIEGDGFTVYGSGLTVNLNTKIWTLQQHDQTITHDTRSLAAQH
ncbi:LPS export ABC transporter periplasmic protein LptC [Thalassotalea agarivorans]|uniref:Lipopolysaccharide export system protein LptC n=1 Tax=Thalassotalea agarivorans TaxID=349064 RepID=A0A1I0FSV5_THASX|nr:LPS export ABC transporter periplasmic protein LptC [Thalassotalea agarivorans]SET61324.1 lipopolysaccharide export system protein LptC [Thalassotalea agarivorans]